MTVDDSPRFTATFAELRRAMPKTSADFRERCVDDGLTLTEALQRRNAELAARASDLAGAVDAVSGEIEPEALADLDSRATHARLDPYQVKLHGLNRARLAAGMKLAADAGDRRARR